MLTQKYYITTKKQLVLIKKALIIYILKMEWKNKKNDKNIELGHDIQFSVKK